MAMRIQTPMVLYSSDRALEAGFDRLKSEALQYVFEGYPVGDYYEAALPERDAFCMRDTCHQCIGAESLGLGIHNFNMLQKFVESISERRDYCGYWEIDRYNRPCPLDYANDEDFWYNLPANFDVLDAIYRLYRFTGNRRYLDDTDIKRFCSLTMEEYIRRWDHDGDGIPDRLPGGGRRGIASYDEGELSIHNLKVGSDLVCAMVRAYESYSEMCRLTNRTEDEKLYHRKAAQLKKDLFVHWFSIDQGLALGMDQESQMRFQPSDPWKVKDFLYRGIADHKQAETLLSSLVSRMNETIIELFCHLPEILWKYGKDEDAMLALRRACDPSLPRRDYPELSFSAIGAVVTGLMGIEPDGEFHRIATLSGLADTVWVALKHVHVLDGFITVEHFAHRKTKLTNECARSIHWSARFKGQQRLCLNGNPVESKQEIMPCSDQRVTYVDAIVAPGQTMVAETEDDVFV